MVQQKKRFEAVGSRVNFPEVEEQVLARWREQDTMHAVDRARVDAPLFVFYEGPPTANGSPGIHHVLSRSFKDIMLRYKTMQGFRVLRRAGWDTHGLPVELEVEKELGFTSKSQVEDYGIEAFNRKCRDSVFRYVREWEDMTERAGVWLDMQDAYVTYHNSYIESGWWVFKRLWDKGLVYEGFKVTPHCPRCVTSLSSHEVALGYKEDTPDPSVFVRFPLSTGQDSSVKALVPLGYGPQGWEQQAPALLVWTTTPWTLTANTAVAIAPDETYVLVEQERQPGEQEHVDTADEAPERLVLAASLVGRVLGEGWKELARFRGNDLVGLAYDPPYAPPDLAGLPHRVYPADYVTTGDGTGLVHTAPAYGAEDAELARTHGLPTVHTVNLRGVLMDGFPGAGRFVKDADKDLTRDLRARGLLLKDEVYKHTYPFCWRCGTPLLYYAKASWYIRTTAMKDEMVAGNQTVHWYPEHIKEGRFGEWLRNNIDWAVSRERYWGTPLPIWRCDECGKTECVGSVQELAERATPQTRALVEGLDLHRPYVDQVELPCTGCGGTMQRVP
ncbi:MAG: class I tRNA ligase family protein, partial [Dehalococcoidia bacterium]